MQVLWATGSPTALGSPARDDDGGHDAAGPVMSAPAMLSMVSSTGSSALTPANVGAFRSPEARNESSKRALEEEEARASAAKKAKISARKKAKKKAKKEAKKQAKLQAAALAAAAAAQQAAAAAASPPPQWPAASPAAAPSSGNITIQDCQWCGIHVHL